MSFRLPDIFHSAGVFLVRCGRHLKVGYATQGEKVTVQVSPLRVPVGVVGRGPATLVGAFLTECPAPKGLAESVRRAAAKLGGSNGVAGDWYEMDAAAIDALVAQFEGAETVPFERADEVVETVETDWTPEAKRPLKQPSKLSSSERVFHPQTVMPKRRATIKQYDYLRRLGAVVAIERDHFLQYLDRGVASRAIDAAKAGRRVVIKSAVPEVRTTTLTKGGSSDGLSTGYGRSTGDALNEDLARHRAERKAATRRSGGQTEQSFGASESHGRRESRNKRSRPATNSRPATKGRPATKSRIYRTERKPIHRELVKVKKQIRREPATVRQYDYLVALGATVNVDCQTFTTYLSKREAASAIDTQKAGVRHVTVERGYTPDAHVGPLSKAASRELIAQTN